MCNRMFQFLQFTLERKDKIPESSVIIREIANFFEIPLLVQQPSHEINE